MGPFQVDIVPAPDLRTVDVQEFTRALGGVVKWCQETLPGYRNSEYRITFNLTGGFKGVLGFLQTVGMFYADESVYIFEGSQLLRVPRLPLRIDADEVLRKNLPVARRLANDLPVAASETANLPEVMLYPVGDEVEMSPWGKLVWGTSRQPFYERELLPPLLDCLVFTDGFRNSVKRYGLDESRYLQLNGQLDDLARCIRFRGTDRPHNPQSLRFKPLAGNPVPPSTHEACAWSDADAKRLYGHFDGQQFVLDALGEHL